MESSTTCGGLWTKTERSSIFWCNRDATSGQLCISSASCSISQRNHRVSSSRTSYELRCTEKVDLSQCDASAEPLPERPIRKLTSTNSRAKKAHETLSNSGASPMLPLCFRVDQCNLSPTQTSPPRNSLSATAQECFRLWSKTTRIAHVSSSNMGELCPSSAPFRHLAVKLTEPAPP